MLTENGIDNDCDKLCEPCYALMLEEKFGYKPIDLPTGITVGEFARIHRHGTYLVRMDGHISSIIQGEVYDIFDCTDTPLTNAWRVE